MDEREQEEHDHIEQEEYFHTIGYTLDQSDDVGKGVENTQKVILLTASRISTIDIETVHWILEGSMVKTNTKLVTPAHWKQKSDQLKGSSKYPQPPLISYVVS